MSKKKSKKTERKREEKALKPLQLLQPQISQPKQQIVYQVGSVVPSAPDIDSRLAISEGYKKNAVVYTIVTQSASKFGSIPVCIYNDASTKAEKANRNGLNFKFQMQPYPSMADMNDDRIVRLNNLIQRPNLSQSQDAFRAECYLWKLLTGECFIWLNRGIQFNQNFQAIDVNGNIMRDSDIDKMPILEMIPLPSFLMYIIHDDSDIWNILGYQFWDTINRRNYRKQDIIFWKNNSMSFDLSNYTHLRGISPLKSGGASLQQNNAAQWSATRAFENDGARGLLVAKYDSPEAIAPGQMDAVRNMVDRRINSHDVSGSVAPILGNWDYLDLAKSQTLPLMDGQQYAAKQLCMIFGFPIEMLESLATFNNRQQAKKAWLNDTIMPASLQFDGELNRVLLKSFGLQGVVCIGSDFSGLTELQDDNLQQAQSLAQMPFLTYNEKRIAMGYPPLPNSLYDELMIPQGVTPSDQMQDDFANMNNSTDNNDTDNSGNGSTDSGSNTDNSSWSD